MTPSYWFLVLLGLCTPLWHAEGVVGWGMSPAPSESECRPFIEKALKERTPDSPQEAVDVTGSEHLTSPPQSTSQEGSIEETNEATTKESIEGKSSDEVSTEGEGELLASPVTTDTASTEDLTQEASESEDSLKTESVESTEALESLPETAEDSKSEDSTETEAVNENSTGESLELNESLEADENVEAISTENTEEQSTGEEQSAEVPEDSKNEAQSTEEEAAEKSGEESLEETPVSTEQETNENSQNSEESSAEIKTDETSGETPVTEEMSAEEKLEETIEETLEENKSEETPVPADDVATESAEIEGGEVADSVETPESLEATASTETKESEEASGTAETEPSVEDKKESIEETVEAVEEASYTTQESAEAPIEIVSEETSDEAKKESSDLSEETTINEATEPEVVSETIEATPATPDEAEVVEEPPSETTEPTAEHAAEEEKAKEPEQTVEDQLTLEFEVPVVRRPREHITEILRLSTEAAETEMLLAKTVDSTLKELKRLYDAAIKPLEILFKYRDLSNRHFGDPEIFSKPLILFMGPWSGGKSSILNYLLDNEFKTSSLRTGAEPSPAYFNILMGGEREEVLDGTQLAADWTFSGLQKFGQGLLDRLRGLRLKSPLLEKVNMVEIPGILEIRKQVERLFPFNDACQWFIDRADIIFLVYDPSKLDVGPETEAILDQLKGREYQTRIILNKADQVKPEELMRVQGTLIWNISPLMSSQEPPVMYSTSLWSVPYEQGAPSRLLHAQERAFLRDLRQAVDRRVENKIASARRFAVRVRNHAKMVDCYLTTYYNHKSFFGNRKKVADDIIEHPQNYHIYEGLSTLTNISRYDLPDPEVYRDFFQLNPLFEFQRLSDTCTYFRGCPINRLDVAISYDLPELVGKYKKQAEAVVEAAERRRSGGNS